MFVPAPDHTTLCMFKRLLRVISFLRLASPIHLDGLLSKVQAQQSRTELLLLQPDHLHAHHLQIAKFADIGAQRLFCVIFGACCNTLLLVLFEILGVLTYDFRLGALKTHIALLVLFMLCAVPR